jgi:hypothetical protein
MNTVLGAGSLLSFVRKETATTDDGHYRFDIVRLTHLCTCSGDFRPQDIVHLVRLCRLLAVTFVQDGWISTDERQQLQELAAKLDAIINTDT